MQNRKALEPDVPLQTLPCSPMTWAGPCTIFRCFTPGNSFIDPPVNQRRRCHWPPTKFLWALTLLDSHIWVLILKSQRGTTGIEQQDALKCRSWSAGRSHCPSQCKCEKPDTKQHVEGDREVTINRETVWCSAIPSMIWRVTYIHLQTQ